MFNIHPTKYEYERKFQKFGNWIESRRDHKFLKLLYGMFSSKLKFK